jgi:hypothetical protein
LLKLEKVSFNATIEPSTFSWFHSLLDTIYSSPIWRLGCFYMPKKSAYLNLGLVLAIALVIASKRLQRRTGVAAADWHKQLLEEALEKFNKMSVQQIERFIAEHYS